MPAESGHIEAIGMVVEYKPAPRGTIEAIGMIAEYSENEYTGRIEAIGMVVEYKEFGIVSVTPTTIHDNGDVEIEIVGDFTVGKAYAVTINGEPCYSGVLGQGYLPVCETAARLNVISPPVAVGGPYDLDAEDVAASVTATLSSAITVVHASYASNAYGLRASGGEPRKVGPRSVLDE